MKRCMRREDKDGLEGLAACCELSGCFHVAREFSESEEASTAARVDTERKSRTGRSLIVDQ